MEDLGTFIKQQRAARGLSQGQLARLSGLHQPTIHRIETGENSPSVENVRAILLALGYDMVFQPITPFPAGVNDGGCEGGCQ